MLSQEKLQGAKHFFVSRVLSNMWAAQVKKILECVYVVWQRTVPFIALYNKSAYDHYYVLRSHRSDVAILNDPIHFPLAALFIF